MLKKCMVMYLMVATTTFTIIFALASSVEVMTIDALQVAVKAITAPATPLRGVTIITTASSGYGGLLQHSSSASVSCPLC